MTVYDWLVSLWRTVVPTLAGLVASALTRLFIDIDEEALAGALMAGFVTAYYGLFRWLEVRVNPRFGIFLGLARPPTYPNKRQL
ncbi:hypothetical protein ACFQ61_08500 [Streptomyces sp. NPDC056500]|uniref:hypothetical protein n=1 Tax=Streptomyces sp. NPDC056500 TaxID=3345840 RepID=UPI0036AADCC6